MINKLKKGDQVNIVAPSSYIESTSEINDGINIFKNWGLNINYENLFERRFKYFSGDDKTRFDELKKAQNSDLIICAKGGWGSSRLLERNPNWGNGWLLGFSDTCSILLSKYAKGSLGSIHGPMISTIANEPSWSINRLKNLLFEGYVDDIEGYPLRKGFARGEVIVSNLTILCFLIGTNHIPSFEGKIIIFEDINEEIYQIDRMLSYLRLSKSLDNIAGVGFGNFFKDSDIDQQKFLENLFIESFENLNIPIVTNLPIGHIKGNAAIPIGFEGVLNGLNGKLSVNLNLD